MGRLMTETPISELLASVEILDHLRVGRDDLKNFRKASGLVQARIGQLMRYGELAFPTWKIIRLGCKDSSGYMDALMKNPAQKIRNSHGNDGIRHMINSMCYRTAETGIPLALVTNAELGFTERATREETYERAAALGLCPCPAEVGPALRLEYRDQPSRNGVYVGMEPILWAYDNKTHIFHLLHIEDGGDLARILTNEPVNYRGSDCSYTTFSPDTAWVFQKKVP